MPSIMHEGLLQPFEHHPAFVAELLTGTLGIKLPDWRRARLGSSDLTEPVPAEYRADRVVVLYGAKGPVLAVVVEVQLRRDRQKRYTWPVYVANIRARLRCPVVLLVVSPRASTAVWGAEPIELGPGSVVTPLVLGPGQLPVVTDVDRARDSPELAVLSALAHGRSHRQRREVLGAFLEALRSLHAVDRDRAKVYHDVVYAALPKAARRYLEDLMSTSTYQFRSEFALSHIARGRTEGRAEGKAQAVLTVLTTRGVEVPDHTRERITGCTDLDQLDTWLRRAVTAASIQDLFAE